MTWTFHWTRATERTHPERRAAEAVVKERLSHQSFSRRRLGARLRVVARFPRLLQRLLRLQERSADVVGFGVLRGARPVRIAVVARRIGLGPRALIRVRDLVALARSEIGDASLHLLEARLEREALVVVVVVVVERRVPGGVRARAERVVVIEALFFVVVASPRRRRHRFAPPR